MFFEQQSNVEKDPAVPRPDHPLLGHLPHPDVLRNPDRRIFLAGEKQVKLISCFLMFLLSTGFEMGRDTGHSDFLLGHLRYITF